MILPAVVAAAGYALMELAFFVERNHLLPWNSSHVSLAVTFFALHLAVAIAAGVAATAIARRWLSSSAPDFGLFAPLAILVAIHALTAYRERINSLPRSALGTAITLGLVALFILGALAHAGALRRSPRLARVVALGLASILLGTGIFRVKTARPLLEEDARPAVAARPSGDRLRLAAETQARVLLFGFDGATWDVLDDLIAEGKMPNVGALAARGKTFDLETVRPTFSPIIWTTVATGKSRFQHGIHDVIQSTLPGGTKLLRSLERTAFLTKTTGVFFRFLYQRRMIPLAAYHSSQIRSTSVFEAASEAGLMATQIEWYVSWPARPLSGVNVSDRFHLQHPEKGLLPGATWPDSANVAMQGDVVTPEDVALDQVMQLVDTEGMSADEIQAWAKAHEKFVEEMRINLARDFTTRNVALDLLRRNEAWRLFGVYFRAVDVSHHLTWKHRRAAGDAAALRARPELRLRTVVDRYHEVMDGIVGEILAATPVDSGILMLSDHGFEDRFGHSQAPQGFAIAAGPPFAPGEERGTLRIEDVAPTVALVLGIPVAEDLAAEPRTDLLESAFVAGFPAKTVPTWEREGRWSETAAGTGNVLEGMDEAEVERLRAIGYIQ